MDIRVILRMVVEVSERLTDVLTLLSGKLPVTIAMGNEYLDTANDVTGLGFKVEFVTEPNPCLYRFTPPFMSDIVKVTGRYIIEVA